MFATFLAECEYVFMQLPDVLPGEPQRGDEEDRKMGRGARGGAGPGVTGPGGGAITVKKEAPDTKVWCHFVLWHSCLSFLSFVPSVFLSRLVVKVRII